ncbi:hypothetical protein [Nonomuraea typhae]|uniref:Short-chain dehydrogenase n=1 Tax=Nonomuraea typhae TaxID=2603600 RepID=A0ABW7Z7M1_9ACTN
MTRIVVTGASRRLGRAVLADLTTAPAAWQRARGRRPEYLAGQCCGP